MEQFHTMAALFQTGDYLVRLLSAALNGSEPPELPRGLAWEQVYHMAKRHCVEQLAFHGAGSRVAREDPDIFRSWERRCMQALAQSLTQEAEQQVIAARFQEAGIPLVPLKGVEVALLYPQRSFRQMTDLDYLLRPEDQPAAAALMAELGYQPGPEEDAADYHDHYQKPPYLAVELHTRLLPADDPISPFFSQAWTHVTCPGGHRAAARFAPEYSYLYIVAHMAKHFYLGGIGIRAVLDLHILRLAWGESLDWNRVRARLREMGLLKFQERMELLSRRWFALPARDGRPNKLRRLEQEVYASGVHGSDVSRLAGALPAGGPDGPRGAGALAGFVFRRLFPGVPYLRRDYPVLGKWPVLLPLCWFHRLLRGSLPGGGRLRRDLRSLSGGRKREPPGAPGEG